MHIVLVIPWRAVYVWFYSPGYFEIDVFQCDFEIRIIELLVDGLGDLGSLTE